MVYGLGQYQAPPPLRPLQAKTTVVGSQQGLRCGSICPVTTGQESVVNRCATLTVCKLPKHDDMIYHAFTGSYDTLRQTQTSPILLKFSSIYVCFIHCNQNVVILINFSSLAVPEVVIMTTSGAARDEKIANMTAFLYQCSSPLGLLLPTWLTLHKGMNNLLHLSFSVWN